MAIRGGSGENIANGADNGVAPAPTAADAAGPGAGAVRINLTDGYPLESGKKLSEYNMEAKGILADYCAIKHPIRPLSSTNRNTGSLKIYSK